MRCRRIEIARGEDEMIEAARHGDAP